MLRMYKVKVSNPKKESKLINPSNMFLFPNQCFQQYTNGKPTKDYYINCGFCETHLIHIWFDEVDNTHKLSTDSKASIKELLPHVKVKPVELELKVEIQ